jgi:hypothetical protein
MHQNLAGRRREAQSISTHTHPSIRVDPEPPSLMLFTTRSDSSSSQIIGGGDRLPKAVCLDLDSTLGVQSSGGPS